MVRGHSRSKAMSPFDRAHTTFYSTLIGTMCLSFTVFEIQPLICRKSPILTTHLHSAPSQGVTPVEFRGDLWHRKTRVPVVSCGVVCVILRLAVLVKFRLVTDRHRAMASTADAQHRAVKTGRVLTCLLQHNCRNTCWKNRALYAIRGMQYAPHFCHVNNIVLFRTVSQVLDKRSVLFCQQY